MREIRSPLDGILSPFATARDAYSAAGISPLLVADFTKPYFRKAGSTSTFSDTFTHSRAGNATMVDSDGLIKWAPHNLALNSAAPATQSITVVSGADYTVEITGSGSVALTGAGTGTVTAGNPVEITASTTTLTLTVTGTPSTMWAYRSDLGGMVNNPDTGTSYVPTTTAAVYQARRNHYTYNGTSWVNSGLLLETEARANLVTASDDMSSWTNSNTTDAKTQTGADGVANTATLVSATANNGTILTTVTATSADYVYSALAKRVTGTGTIEMTIDGGSTWVDVTALINASVYTQVGTGAGANTTNPQIGFRLGTSGDEIAVQINQLEATSGQFSSPIPTTGATATRAAETLTIAAADMPWDASNVSLQMQGKMTYADTNAVEEILFARWYAGATQYIQINHNTSGTNRLEYRQQSDATLHRVLINNPYSPGVDIPYNVAMRNTSTAINGAFSGTAETAVTTPTALPDLSATDFDLGYDYMGCLQLFRAWNVDIGDAGIEDASA